MHSKGLATAYFVLMKMTGMLMTCLQFLKRFEDLYSEFVNQCWICVIQCLKVSVEAQQSQLTLKILWYGITVLESGDGLEEARLR